MLEVLTGVLCVGPGSLGSGGWLAVERSLGGRLGRSSLPLQLDHADGAAPMSGRGSAACGTRRQVSRPLPPPFLLGWLICFPD